MTALTAAQRNVAAECRFVEEGHRVYLVHDHAEVKSDTLDRVTYEVRAHGEGDLVVFSCTCTGGRRGRQVPRGVTPCKHAAGLGRRLERAGLADWVPVTGRWHVTDKAREFGDFVAKPFDASNDPPTALTTRGRTVGASSRITDPDQLAAQLRAGM